MRDRHTAILVALRLKATTGAVDGILARFTATIAKLETVAASHLETANKHTSKAQALDDKAAHLRTEAKAAITAAANIRSMLGAK